MTHEPEHVEVVCLHCGTVSTTYLRDGAGDRAEEWHPVDGEEMPGTCPECGATFAEEREREFDVIGPHPAA